MRRADEAVRNDGQLVASGPLAGPKLARALAGDVVENAAERAETVPAGLKCNVDDRLVRVPQQRLGALDPTCEQVTVGRNPERVLEGSGEMRLGDAANARQPFDRPFLVRGCVHPVLGAEQAAQQLRVLACRPSGHITASPSRH